MIAPSRTATATATLNPSEINNTTFESGLGSLHKCKTFFNSFKLDQPIASQHDKSGIILWVRNTDRQV